MSDPPEPATGPADEAFSIDRQDRKLIVTGEIDVDTAPLIARALKRIDGDAELDLSGVEFIDSSGLRILISAHQSLEERDAVLRIVDPSPQVRRILELTNIDAYLNVSP